MFKAMVRGSLLTVLMVATSVQAAEKVSVMLDWYANPDHAPLLVAEQIGAFKKEGLEVDLVPPSDPSMPPRLVAAQQADLAISYQPQLYMYADQGLPLVRVGTLISSPLNTLITLPSSGINAIADLKGKKIGYSNSGVDEATLGTILKQQGLTLQDVTMVNVNFQLVSALLSKKVDAIIGGYRNVEALEIRDQGVKPNVFNIEDFGVPTYDELIVLANKNNAHDPKIKKFMLALKEGTDYLLAHPQETWQAYAKRYPESNNKTNQESWMQTLPLFARNPLALDSQRYQAYGHFMFEHKLISKELPVSDYAIELK